MQSGYVGGVEEKLKMCDPTLGSIDLIQYAAGRHPQTAHRITGQGGRIVGQIQIMGKASLLQVKEIQAIIGCANTDHPPIIPIQGRGTIVSQAVQVGWIVVESPNKLIVLGQIK